MPTRTPLTRILDSRLKRLLLFGAPPDASAELLIPIGLINFISMFGISMTMPFLLLHVLTGNLMTAALDLAALVPFLICLVLMRRGRHLGARMLLLIAVHIEISVFSVLYGVGSGLENFLLAAALAPFVLFTTCERRYVIASLAGTSLVLILTCAATLLDVPGFLQFSESVRASVRVIYLLSTFALVVLLGWILFILQVHKQATLERISLLNAQTASLASLGEMAGNIAHEIASPISAIELQALLLQRRMPRDEQVTGACRKIGDICARITGIIKAMRILARDTAAHDFHPLDPAEAIELAAGLCRERFKQSGVTFEVDCPRQITTVLGDTTQLSHVVLNLLGNAFDATEQRAKRQVAVSGFVHEACYRIVVQDNGPGIPTELRSKVVEPFFTTKPIGKGTGLGLSITRSLVEKHGGRLHFLGGEGAMKVVVDLPLIQTGSTPQAGLAPPAPVEPRSP